jgi:hypothetical protein
MRAGEPRCVRTDGERTTRSMKLPAARRQSAQQRRQVDQPLRDQMAHFAAALSTLRCHTPYTAVRHACMQQPAALLLAQA